MPSVASDSPPEETTRASFGSWPNETVNRPTQIRCAKVSFYRSDIPNGDRFAEPIQATVRSVSESGNDSVDSSVVLVDDDGVEVELLVWRTHALSLDLREGRTYEFTELRGNSWESSDGHREYQLSSTVDTTATETTDTDSMTRLLVLGDTHVGYRHRPTSKQTKGGREYDGRHALEAALRRGEKEGVDAVVHAGDLFDHCATGNDRLYVADMLTSEFADLPFYYIYGNHDLEASRATFDSELANRPNTKRLSSEPVSVGPAGVQMFGIDHRAAPFDSAVVPMTPRTGPNAPTVLVIHETPYPVKICPDKCRHKHQGVNLQTELEQMNADVDVVICGHIHAGYTDEVDTVGTPIVVTGSLGPLKTNAGDDSGYSWLVEMDEAGTLGAIDEL